MSFNEESARKIIDYLLEDDIDDYSRWLPLIEEFNSEQIEKLLNGERRYEYPVKNKDIFYNLVRKFNNFAEIILKWYKKEENYKYLKQLWLQYICIEDIRVLLKKDKDGQKLTNYLEEKKINYSQWPKEIKEEFKKCVNKTIGTEIHEEEFKKKMNKEHSDFNKAFEMIKDLKNSIVNLFKDNDKKSQELFEKNSNSLITNVVKSIFSFVGWQLISQAKGSIDYGCFENFLVRQLQKYSIDVCDAKKIAADIIKSDICPENGIFIWRASNYIDLDDTWDKCTSWGPFNCGEKFMELSLEGKENETISLTKSISTIFQSNIVCGLITVLSFGNLCFSAYKFHRISKLTETVAGKKYEDRLKTIKQNFRIHLNELDLNGDSRDCQKSINYVKNNIENDLKKLEDLVIEIDADIKQYKKERKESIASLVVSILGGASSAIGTFVATNGISTGFYVLSFVSNIISGTGNTIDINKCNLSIEELKKIKKDAEEEKEKMKQLIDELELMGKEKELKYPNYYYQKFNEIIQKQNNEAQNYILNKNLILNR